LQGGIHSEAESNIKSHKKKNGPRSLTIPLRGDNSMYMRIRSFTVLSEFANHHCGFTTNCGRGSERAVSVRFDCYGLQIERVWKDERTTEEREGEKIYVKQSRWETGSILIFLYGVRP
jgi:hypothetical protein